MEINSFSRVFSGDRVKRNWIENWIRMEYRLLNTAIQLISTRQLPPKLVHYRVFDECCILESIDLVY